MSKKQDSFYFQNFIACADYACRAARILEEAMQDFNPKTLSDRLSEMHEVEHAADVKKHELLNTLLKAFITPIEREDIVQVSQNIDEMIDRIEDVLIRLYYNHVQTIRPDALKLAEIVICCCDEVQKMLREFEHFHHSKMLHRHIVQINSLEEQADKLYISCMYDLHGSRSTPLDIIAWREIYTYLEKCADTGEHIADVVESVVMKNS